MWNYEMLETQYFSNNLKLADITQAYKENDPTLVENYKLVSVRLCVSKIFKRIIQEQSSSFIDEFLSSNLCGYRKGFNIQYLLFHSFKNGRKLLIIKDILEQC